MKAIRRFLSLALTLAMVLSFFPGVPASAAGSPITLTATADGENIVLVVKSNANIERVAGIRFVFTAWNIELILAQFLSLRNLPNSQS